MNRQVKSLLWCACSLAMLAGCAEQKKMDMSAMKPPERAKELDQLEPWIGNWTMSSEGCMGGQKIKSSGTFVCSWECDKTVLIGRGTEQMDGKDMKMSMLELYTWNPKAKKFNSYYFGMGMASQGSMTYDASTKTYHICGKGPDPMTGGDTIFEGDAKLIDSSTIEMTWCMWDGWKMKKTGEGKGTMKRS